MHVSESQLRGKNICQRSPACGRPLKMASGVEEEEAATGKGKEETGAVGRGWRQAVRGEKQKQTNKN